MLNCCLFNKRLLTQTLTTLFFLILFSTSLNSQSKKVLFLGNSYTSVNNLPLTVYKLAQSNGDTLIYDSNAPGGYTLNGHSTNTTSLDKIRANNWDFVVLQEQSQIPSFPPTQVATDCLPYGAILVDSIKSNYACSEPLFYMTWGRKYGDSGNCAAWPPVCTYEGMQWRLRWGYLELAANNNSSVAPVGLAWYNSIMANDTLDLYSGDYSHPNLYGTYLTACVFYATIFRKSPVGLTNYNIDLASAEFLQTIAQQTVFNPDSIPTYFGYGDIPFAHFYWNNAGNNTVEFTNHSFNGVSYLWDFGDGDTSTLENPTHTYQNSGTYHVSLTVNSNCQSITYTNESVIASVSSQINFITNDDLIVYPNPAHDILNIKISNTNNYNIEIQDMQGRLVYSDKINNNNTSIDISRFCRGIYILRIIGKNNTITEKIAIK